MRQEVTVKHISLISAIDNEDRPPIRIYRQKAAAAEAVKTDGKTIGVFPLEQYFLAVMRDAGHSENFDQSEERSA